MTNPSDGCHEMAQASTPLWSDQEVEDLITGRTTTDPAFDGALRQLRTLSRSPAPEPRADVLAMLQGGPVARGRDRKRTVVLALAATVGISSVTLAGAAAASETVREPLQAIFHRVVDGIQGGSPSSPTHNPSSIPPSSVQTASVPARPTPTGSDSTGPGGIAGGASGGGGHQNDPSGGSGKQGTNKGAQHPSQGPAHGQSQSQGQGQGRGQGQSKGQGNGQGQGQGGGHGNGQGHGQEQGHGRGQGRGHAQGKAHGTGH